MSIAQIGSVNMPPPVVSQTPQAGYGGNASTGEGIEKSSSVIRIDDVRFLKTGIAMCAVNQCAPNSHPIGNGPLEMTDLLACERMKGNHI